ncbi:MAG: DUF4435 domain-containing protein [Candidatus Heimdallarchaeota archaeon]|nr:DUF4435 domain-containing protein [Candidatus Heimdallarchaeota archaeon]
MKEYINSSTLSNQIGMLRSHPLHKKHAILLVEGPSDTIFFKNLLNPELVIISCEGKTNVLFTLEKVVIRNIRAVIAILDSDLDYFIPNPTMLKIDKHNRKNIRKILFYTDSHDLETMLLDSFAFDKFIQMYAEPKRIEKIEKNIGDLRNHLLEQAYKIGLLKLLSLQNNWHLSFKKINYDSFFDYKTLTLLEEKAIDEILKQSSNSNADKNEILKCYRNENKHAFDPWLITSGHDMMKILLKSLKYNLGIKHKMENFNKTYQIEDVLILSYEFSFFSHTRLFEHLTEWEEENYPYRVFA